MSRSPLLRPAAALLLAAALSVPVGAGPASASAPPAGPDPASPGSDGCPVGYYAVDGAGLDGGIGCRALGSSESGPEGPYTKLQSRSAGSVARYAQSGYDRLAAIEQSRALYAAADARRLAEGGKDFVTAAGAPVPNSGNTWTNIGPKPLIFDDPEFPSGSAGLLKAAGRVSAIAVDTRDTTGNTLYVGPAAGGIWKSTDGGTTFVPVGDGLATLAMGALAVDPTNGWVYAGTGEEATGTDNYAGVGVYRSKDGGTTWERNAQVPADTIISHVAVSPILGSPSRVFVATSKGLWRSVDGGDTYADVLLPTNAAGTAPGDRFLQNVVTDVRVRPGLPDEVIAAVGWRSGGGASNRLDGKGLYRSTNGGATFTRNNGTGFGVSTSTSDDPIGRISLAYNPKDANVLWALVQDAGLFNNDQTPLDFPGEPAQPARVPFTVLNGIYRSGDNGANWTLKGEYADLVAAPGSAYTPTFTAGQAGPGVQSWYNQWIEVDPNNADKVLIGLEEVFQTFGPETNTPAGKAKFIVAGRYSNTCTPVSITGVQCPLFTGTGGAIHPDQHDGVFVDLGSGKSRAYIGNDGGTYRQDRTSAATDNYTSEAWFNTADNFSTNQFHAAIMGGDGIVYGGMQDNGTVRVQPTPRNGKPAGYAVEILGGDGFDVMVEPDNSEKMYSEVQGGLMRKSVNGGRNHTTITPSGAPRAQFFTPFEMDPTDKNHIVYGAGKVYANNVPIEMKTSNNWVELIDLATAPRGVPAGSANAVDVQGASTYVAFCGECNATPFAGNGGQYDPAIFTGGIATNVQDGCTATKNTNACWHVATAAGLPKRFVGGIDIDPADPTGKTIYAAVSSYRRRWLYDSPARTEPAGILFRSTDGGESFQDISGDLPETFGADVIVTGGRLVVATDAGVFANSAKDSPEFVPFGTGLPAAVPAYDLSVNPQGDKILLATHGRGLYVLDTAVEEQPPPLIPEVPLTVLLPLSAVAAYGLAYGYSRRRRQWSTPAV